MLKKMIAVVAVVVGIGFGLTQLAQAYTDKTPTQAYDMVAASDDVYIVDVRTSAEWTWVGHPGKNKAGAGAVLEGKVVNESYEIYGKGDVLIVNTHFVSDMKELFPDKDTPIILICRSGARSVKAALALEAAGYTNVFNMLTGFEGPTDANGYRTINGWKVNGLPYSFSGAGAYAD